MKIDVEKSPPTLLEIADARRKRLKITTIAAVAFACSVAGLVSAQGIILALALLIFICSMWLVSVFAAKEFDLYKPISPYDCGIVASWMSSSASIASYIGKVNAQGRELVGAEFFALRRSFEERMNERKKAAVYGALR